MAAPVSFSPKPFFSALPCSLPSPPVPMILRCSPLRRRPSFTRATSGMIYSEVPPLSSALAPTVLFRPSLPCLLVYLVPSKFTKILRGEVDWLISGSAFNFRKDVNQDRTTNPVTLVQIHGSFQDSFGLEHDRLVYKLGDPSQELVTFGHGTGRLIIARLFLEPKKICGLQTGSRTN